MNLKHRARRAVILFAAFVSLVYLAYRGTYTLNLTTGYATFASLFLFVAETFGVISVMLFFLQVWDTTEPPQLPVLEGRTVDVFVPTYNEDVSILRATLEGCSRLDYPHRTYLCDDGGTDARVNDPEKGPGARARADEIKQICAETGATYLTRPKNQQAKAGNLNHAFARTDGEFIIIFDADHVPEPNFISRLIGYFADPKMGFVQTPHAFYNFDSFQAKLDHKKRRYWEEGHLFYNVIQPGRNRWHCPIFSGAATVFRRKALAEIGYIATETITEDLHTGMRINAKGWKSLGISERMIVGQAAPDITTFHTQRLRWGEGNLSIMAYDFPLTMKGLTFSQRLCYFGSMIHWAGGIFKLPIYVTPIMMLLTGVPPVNEFTWTLAVITALYLVASIVGVQIASNGFGSFLYGEIFCMVNFWTQVHGSMRALFLRKFQQFIVTNKRGRQSKSIWPFVRAQVILLGVSVLALFWGWYRILCGVSDDYFKPIIPTFWVLFHMGLILIVIYRALWPEDRRFAYRHRINLPMIYEVEGAESSVFAMGMTADLCEGGVRLIAYEPLPERAKLRLSVRFASEKVSCSGEIRWHRELVPGSQSADRFEPRAWEYGIAFQKLSAAETDAINRLTLHYAVPRLYKEYTAGHDRTFWRRMNNLIFK